MTGPLYTIAKWCLGILPVDAAGRRCFDETLADWRKEAAHAACPLARAAVSARALWSVSRCVLMVSAREVRTRQGMVPLLRLAAWAGAWLLVFIALNWSWSVPAPQGSVRVGPIVVLFGSVNWVMALMPLSACLSSAVGRHLPIPGPRLGPALVIGAVMFVAMGWVMPAANQALRVSVLRITTGPGTLPPLPPGIGERSFGELIGLLGTTDSSRAAASINLRLVLVAAVPVMLAVGTTARQLRGRRRVVASLLPLLVFFIPFLANMSIGSVAGFVVMWPALLAVILITRALVRAEGSFMEPA